MTRTNAERAAAALKVLGASLRVLTAALKVLLSASLQGAVRLAEDREQSFGLFSRLTLILRRLGEEGALADEHVHR